MSSYTPPTNLWVERSRLDGIVLEGVSYGVFLLLTVQSLVALTRRPRYGGKIAAHRSTLIFYIVITFILATLAIAADAKYAEMIWIDLRDAPGGPLLLIKDSLKYHINVVALCCGHIQDWFMQALLLHRCFVVWNWSRSVMIPMIILYIIMIGLSIAVQVKSSVDAIFYDINTELAYTCVEVGLNVIYTILVVYRLLAMRRKLKEVGQSNYGPYNTVVLMIVESVMPYTILAIMFIIAFSLHDDGLSTICLLSMHNVQAIAQLLIIIRVARGRAIAQEWSAQVAAAPTTVVFSRTLSDATEESKDEGIAKREKDIVHTYPASEEAVDGDVCAT